MRTPPVVAHQLGEIQVHSFTTVLGTVHARGRNRTFRARFRVPSNSPIGRVLVVGHTPHLPNIYYGSVVVVRRAPNSHLPNTGEPAALSLLALGLIGGSGALQLATRGRLRRAPGKR